MRCHSVASRRRVSRTALAATYPSNAAPGTLSLYQSPSAPLPVTVISVPGFSTVSLLADLSGRCRSAVATIVRKLAAMGTITAEDALGSGFGANSDIGAGAAIATFPGIGTGEGAAGFRADLFTAVAGIDATDGSMVGFDTGCGIVSTDGGGARENPYGGV